MVCRERGKQPRNLLRSAAAPGFGEAPREPERRLRQPLAPHTWAILPVGEPKSVQPLIVPGGWRMGARLVFIAAG
jgi:hypothetical protein